MQRFLLPLYWYSVAMPQLLLATILLQMYRASVILAHWPTSVLGEKEICEKDSVYLILSSVIHLLSVLTGLAFFLALPFAVMFVQRRSSLSQRYLLASLCALSWGLFFLDPFGLLNWYMG